MSDFPPAYTPPLAMINDCDSREPMAHDVVHQQPPSYGFLNPSVFRNINDADVKPTQCQPQPQWATQGNVGSIQGVPGVVTCGTHSIENYMVWSIINSLFCCLCLGLVACYYSSETDNYKFRGDIQGALNASRNARTMNIVATVFGLVMTTISIILFVTTGGIY